VLARLIPAAAVEILWELPEERRRELLATAPPERGGQWVRNRAYPEDTVGRLMEHPLAIFSPDLTAHQATERLRELVRTAFITYAFVADPAGRLLGVLVFRELLFAPPQAPLRDIMLAEPFSLRPDLPITDAMREVLRRHYPVYPVCDADGRLVGVLRGQTLFQQQTLELSAQPGAMVGVEKEERLATPWWRSLRSRHPWLQLNLVTAFAAAGVVGFFQTTIDRLVILAVFLPVLAGQSGNTGCQALAVTLRGMTLGDLVPGRGRRILAKEALLGLLNGGLVGLTAGIGMLITAWGQSNPHALLLALVVFLAMVASCMVSGLSGVLVPMALQRLGADPATASSIFLTTATDVTSMGLFLALATWLVH
jgi:magnesium transporter